MNQRFNSYIVFLLFQIKTCISLPQSGFSCGAGMSCANSPYGPCCSQYGYCGNTADYCSPNMGCQAGCWNLNPSTTHIFTTTPSPSAASNSGESKSGGSNSDLAYKILVPVILLAVIALVAFLFWNKWQKHQIEQQRLAAEKERREKEEKEREIQRMTAYFQNNNRLAIGYDEDDRMVAEEEID
ncbi:hevein-like preproprotein [Gigaspora margarita]|uniref:Hevein-like preproprotein n=1 Tax=Gigaspora margarita TaxID=4874 RepID=A0A8H3X8N5_GIGMA|nr:hevein-like preproprotein [Gigaspora margarita]